MKPAGNNRRTLRLLQFQSHSITFCHDFIVFSDIEAQIRELQSKRREQKEQDNEHSGEIDQVGLGQTGYYDPEIYDKNKFGNIYTYIPADDELDVSIVNKVLTIFIRHMKNVNITLNSSKLENFFEMCIKNR